MRKKKVRRVCKLDIDFVSLVDRPANPMAEVVLVKREDKDMPEDTPAVEQPATEVEPEKVAEVQPEPEPEKTEAVEKQLTDLHKRLEIAEAALRHERDLRATVEAQDIAKSLVGLNQDASQFATLVKSLRTSLPQKTWDELHRVFKALDEQIRKSKLFGEIGSSTASGSDSAADQIEKAVLATIEKGEAKDRIDALTKVIASNPDLYRQYRRETLKG